MLSNHILLRYLALICIFLFAGICSAGMTFEGVGTVNNINKVAKTITVDGQRMIVDGNVQVTVNNAQHHLLNVLKVGSLLTVSGIKDSMNNFIVTSSYLHHAPKKK